MMAVLSVALAMIQPWNGGDGDVLEDGDVVLVRGGDLDLDILPEGAVRYHRIHGV
jgi:ribosomal protein S12